MEETDSLIHNSFSLLGLPVDTSYDRCHRYLNQTNFLKVSQVSELVPTRKEPQLSQNIDFANFYFQKILPLEKSKIDAQNRINPPKYTLITYKPKCCAEMVSEADDEFSDSGSQPPAKDNSKNFDQREHNSKKECAEDTKSSRRKKNKTMKAAFPKDVCKLKQVSNDRDSHPQMVVNDNNRDEISNDKRKLGTERKSSAQEKSRTLVFDNNEDNSPSIRDHCLNSSSLNLRKSMNNTACITAEENVERLVQKSIQCDLFSEEASVASSTNSDISDCTKRYMDNICRKLQLKGDRKLETVLLTNNTILRKMKRYISTYRRDNSKSGPKTENNICDEGDAFYTKFFEYVILEVLSVIQQIVCFADLEMLHIMWEDLERLVDKCRKSLNMNIPISDANITSTNKIVNKQYHNDLKNDKNGHTNKHLSVNTSGLISKQNKSKLDISYTPDNICASTSKQKGSLSRKSKFGTSSKTYLSQNNHNEQGSQTKEIENVVGQYCLAVSTSSSLGNTAMDKKLNQSNISNCKDLSINMSGLIRRRKICVPRKSKIEKSPENICASTPKGKGSLTRKSKLGTSYQTCLSQSNQNEQDSLTSAKNCSVQEQRSGIRANREKSNLGDEKNGKKKSTPNAKCDRTRQKKFVFDFPEPLESKTKSRKRRRGDIASLVASASYTVPRYNTVPHDFAAGTMSADRRLSKRIRSHPPGYFQTKPRLTMFFMEPDDDEHIAHRKGNMSRGDAPMEVTRSQPPDKKGRNSKV